MKTSLVHAVLGLAVGDALGVPFEFRSRAELDHRPCTGMTGFGSHYQPAGTWSDDTSMALILLEALLESKSLEDERDAYRRWYEEGYMTPHGVCFDIGGTTLQALREGRGLTGEHSNGNGSLMRIAPMAWFLDEAVFETRRERVFAESALTHAHLRSQLACWLMVETLVELRAGKAPPQAIDLAWSRIDRWSKQDHPTAVQWLHFRDCRSSLARKDRREISSSGYVVHTLEASLWCLLTTASYEEAVLAAVNLGSDTDTTGAVTGALAGTWYGAQAIPETWLSTLVKRTELEDLCGRIRS